ncbi:MAG: single-stranded-DNA-specific exonuclease RecJ [Candidatus Levybacteria bacterium]|nr:single-stranded-DNA-specific exonuclease RecJ [Candidatus Levybacteria bacterium]
MKKWEVIHKFKVQSSKFKVKELIDILLENRGIKTAKARKEFLNPKLEDVTTESVGIDEDKLKKALSRIKKAIQEKEQIVIFGDYDVDGICGTAILWETLHSLGAKVLPYIPHRVDEGYGLSKKGISNLQFHLFDKLRTRMSNVKLIITVDNGIVANEAVQYAIKQGIDVIITDHHVPSKKLPKAHAIVHTTKLCGTGVAYLLAKKILKQVQHDNGEDDHLGLVALATVADLVPLTSSNRTLLTHGLKVLRQSNRPGLLALCKEAGINQKTIGTYEIGYIIAPRLNAMGRITSAMDSLRLLCTKSQERASLLAQKLCLTNKERQLLTEETVLHAFTGIRNQESGTKKLLFVAHETYQQGVIGLVAGKIVEEFYRPTIVVSKGEVYSKASARSVAGFNMIEFIRQASNLLVDVGGHPMAAGFTVETEKLVLLQEKLEGLAETLLNGDKLTKTLRIDCELPLSIASRDLLTVLEELAPFGMGNPQPSFVSRGVFIEDMRLVGRDKKHIKFQFKSQNAILRLRSGQEVKIDGISFGMGERAHEFSIGQKVDIVYTISEDKWNGNTALQLKIKDLKPS